MHSEHYPAPKATAPQTTLRILHLEDNEDDRELVKAALTGAGLPCAFTYASGEAEFLAALGSAEFDLILSDFTLPGYGGNEALALARAEAPDTPYLFVSGTIGEDRAIDSLKSGATDYVLKTRLERLLPAVRRALSENQERARRHAAEQALRHSEERFREMAETIRDVFWVRSCDHRELLYVSPAFEQLWGRPLTELHAQPSLWFDAIVPEDRARVDAALARLAEGAEYRVEHRVRRPDDTIRWVEDRGYPVLSRTGHIERIVGVVTDITERRQLETQLRQSQKMEAIGQLAGGIAHDFNNILTVIVGNASLLLDAGGHSPEHIARLTQIYTAGERAGNLTRQLLVFSRRQTIQLKPIDLNEVIGETSKMLVRLIGEHISLELILAPALPCTEADAGMIEQVLLNLAVNARDAMPRGGRLVIQTSEVTLTERDVEKPCEGGPGRFIRVDVSDSGSGIAPETLPHIFEPFFTTKEPGKGTGMGLATVYGIVQQHGGWIDVESTIDVGTTFGIYLPAASSGVKTSPVPVMEGPARGGRETILLVEDEAPVREYASAVLEKFGYRVLQAASGKEALAIWKWHASRIALLFTDVIMPDDLSGIELANRLQTEKPGLRVICASGYSPEMMAQFPSPPAGLTFIHKPYQPQTLARTVREALDRNPADRATS